MFLTCKNENPVETQIKTFDISKGFSFCDTITLSSIADSVSWVILETTDQSLITQISSIHIGKDIIVLWDDRRKKLMQFTRDGYFVNEIGRIGKGPGEFISLLSFAVDDEGQYIFILENGTQKILVYDFANNFQSSIKIDCYPSRMTFSNNHLILYSPRPTQSFNEGYAMSIYNTKEKTWKRIAKMPDENIGLQIPRFSNINRTSDGIRFWDCYSDTVYQIGPEFVIYPVFYLDYGSRRIPYDILKDKNQFSQKAFEFDLVVKLLDTEYLLFLDGLSKGARRRILFEKETGLSYHLTGPDGSSQIIDDIDECYPFWPGGVINERNCFDVIEPIEVNIDYPITLRIH